MCVILFLLQACHSMDGGVQYTLGERYCNKTCYKFSYTNVNIYEVRTARAGAIPSSIGMDECVWNNAVGVQTIHHEASYCKSGCEQPRVVSFKAYGFRSVMANLPDRPRDSCRTQRVVHSLGSRREGGTVPVLRIGLRKGLRSSRCEHLVISL